MEWNSFLSGGKGISFDMEVQKKSKDGGVPFYDSNTFLNSFRKLKFQSSLGMLLQAPTTTKDIISMPYLTEQG